MRISRINTNWISVNSRKSRQNLRIDTSP
jgi:hypothetical protein